MDSLYSAEPKNLQGSDFNQPHLTEHKLNFIEAAA